MATPPDFTAGAVLTAAQMNAVGLWRVASYTSTAGSGTITCADAFTSDFEMYRIIVRGGSTSTSTGIAFQFQGVTTNSYYYSMTYSTFAGAAPATLAGGPIANWALAGDGTTTTVVANFDVYATADQKWATGMHIVPSTTGNNKFWGGYNTSTAAVTGFTLTTASGTFNAGVQVHVYGYRN